MKPTSLINVHNYKAHGIDKLVKNAMPFIIKNFQLITMPESDIEEIKNIRLLANSPINNIFKNLVKTDNLDNFWYYNLKSYKIEDIPEVLTYNEILINGGTLPFSTPDSLQKVWFNATPYLATRRNPNDDLTIVDNSQLAIKLVETALVSSYENSDMWLTNDLCSFIIKIFSIVLASLMQIAYNLDFNEYKVVQTYFAAHYAKLLGEYSDKSEIPYLLNRCGFLGSVADISERLSVGFDMNKTPDSINLAESISKSGITRLNKFSVKTLLQLINLGVSDHITIVLALDYPPFFVWVLLKTISGWKNPVISNVIKRLNLKKEVEEFADKLSHNKQFLNTI